MQFCDSLIHYISFSLSDVLISGNSNSIDVGNAGNDGNDATQRGNVGSLMLFVGECLFCATFLVWPRDPWYDNIFVCCWDICCNIVVIDNNEDWIDCNVWLKLFADVAVDVVVGGEHDFDGDVDLDSSPNNLWYIVASIDSHDFAFVAYV